MNKGKESHSSFENWPRALGRSLRQAHTEPDWTGPARVQCMWFNWRRRTSVALERALSCTVSRARSRDGTGLEELDTAVRAGLPRAGMPQEQYPRDFVVAPRRGILTEPASQHQNRRTGFARAERTSLPNAPPSIVVFERTPNPDHPRAPTCTHSATKARVAQWMRKS